MENQNVMKLNLIIIILNLLEKVVKDLVNVHLLKKDVKPKKLDVNGLEKKILCYSCC